VARALVEVALDGVEEKAALTLKSGETAELAVVNKNPQRVLCEVTVEHLNGVLNSLVAVELGGRRLYLGRSSRAGESISAEIEPGGVEILRVRVRRTAKGERRSASQARGGAARTACSYSTGERDPGKTHYAETLTRVCT
jgi:hypothetical protein